MKTVIDIKEILKMIKNKVMGNIIIKMELSSKENLKIINLRVKALRYHKMEIALKATGKMI
jgi:hypothetical protein